GTSFMECTAMSAWFSSRAVCSSLTNKPLPPIFASGASSSLSPRLTIGTRLTRICGCSCSRRALTCSACQRARALLRVAIRISRGMGAIPDAELPWMIAGSARRLACRGSSQRGQITHRTRSQIALEHLHQLAYARHMTAADGQRLTIHALEEQLKMSQRRALQALDPL